MDLLLMRHGIAAVDAAEGDAARPLTPRGITHTREVVAGLKKLDLRVDRVYHSPLRRAVETAALLGPLHDGAPLILDGLAEPPSDSMFRFIEGERVALVGHQPWMAELCGLLTTGERAGGDGLDWRKGGVAWLSGDLRYGGMVLRAFLPPRVLRRF